jgi:hypothetical protein
MVALVAIVVALSMVDGMRSVDHDAVVHFGYAIIKMGTFCGGELRLCFHMVELDEWSC